MESLYWLPQFGDQPGEKIWQENVTACQVEEVTAPHLMGVYHVLKII